jgi:hypothetical protein
MHPLNFPITNKNTTNSVNIYPAQLETQSFGRLRVNCTTVGLAPVENATVSISYSGVPDSVVEQLTTELPAPNIDYSLAPSEQQPYADYTIQVSSADFAPVTIQDSEILPNVTSIQNAEMTRTQESLYVIPPHTLFGDYPPKIAEAEIKPASETGEIVLSQVVIPEFVVVHDGPPTDTSASNYYIRFRDYIKNVASSEIYATWPESTIQANIFAILSFTLNRVFTDKWMPGRNIYNNIGLQVDQLFVNYLSRPNVRQPILTQYCDGNRVQCPNWMTFM